MKKRIIISVICGIFMCCTAVYTFATTGIVKVDDLRLREENSTSSEIITLLSTGEKVEIISKTDNGWYKVKYKEYEGYVSSDFIEAKETNIETEKVEKPIEEPKQEQTVPEQQSQTPVEPETTVHEEQIQQEEVIKQKTETNIIKTIGQNEKLYGIPLINSNSITVVKNEIEVKVLAEVNGWSYIVSNVLKGWVRNEKLRDKDDVVVNTNNNQNEEQTLAKEKIGYISGSEVNFRKTPSTAGEIISVLTLNKEVIILENSNGWVKVKVGDQIGYVSATYVADKKVTTTSRSSTTRKNQNTTSENKKTETVQNVPQNPNGTDIVEYAKQYLGYKYVYGGTTPSGFDCSGFTQYVYKKFGYSLNRTANSQSNNGVGVSKINMQPGDLICFSNLKGSTSIGHVGIYIGNGQFIHAANSRKGVIISNVDGAGFYYVCSRRII